MSLVLPSAQARKRNRVTWQTQWWCSYVIAHNTSRLRLFLTHCTIRCGDSVAREERGERERERRGEEREREREGERETRETRESERALEELFYIISSSLLSLSLSLSSLSLSHTYTQKPAIKLADVLRCDPVSLSPTRTHCKYSKYLN